MLADAAAPVVLAQDRLLERLPEHGAEVISLDSTIVQGAAPEPRLAGGADPSDLAYVIYTSGSTGRPKGAMNSHRGIVNRLLWMQAPVRADAGGPGAPEDAGQLRRLGLGVLLAADDRRAAGARASRRAPGPGLSGRDDRGARGSRRCTSSPRCCRSSWRRRGSRRCASLRRVMASGEALPLDLVRRFLDRLGAELHNLYGPTEAAVDVTYWACEREDGRGAGADRPAGRQHRRSMLLDPAGRAGAGRGARRAAHRRRPARPRLPGAAGPDGRALRARPVRRERARRAALPHRATWRAAGRTARSSSWAASTTR